MLLFLLRLLRYSGLLPLLLPHGDLLPSGYRSYYMDLLLRMSILETWYRSILRLLRIPLSSARSVETLVETPLRAPWLTRTRTRTLSKLEEPVLHCRSSANGANAPPLWRLFDFAGYAPAIDCRTCSRIICFRCWLFCSTPRDPLLYWKSKANYDYILLKATWLPHPWVILLY